MILTRVGTFLWPARGRGDRRRPAGILPRRLAAPLAFLRRHHGAILLPIVLAATTVAFTWKLLFTGLAVIGYDTMTYMYPYRVFAAEALRAGHVPLWNPWIYFGVPFLANLQSAVFYPLHFPFLVLPGPFAMNASVVLHFFLAAWFAALAARVIVRLDWWSAGIAGVIYGFSGFVGAQVGHLNQLNAAAWLPLAILAIHLALESHAIRWAVATGVILAVQLLAGHAQESYMTIVAIVAYVAFHVAVAAWTLAVPRRAPTGDGIGAWARSLAEIDVAVVPGRMDWRFRGGAALRWRAWWCHAALSAALLAVAGAFAAGLAALQALPTAELTAASIRASGMSFGEAISFSLPPRELFVGLLPAFGLASPTSNEFLGWIGFTGAILALAGITFRARHPAVLFFAILAILALLLALGNHTPIYGSIFRVPGMNLFRVPARWLFLATFGAAIIGGAGFAFLRAPGPSLVRSPLPPGPWFRLAAASRLLLAIVVIGAAVAVLWPFQHVRADPAALALVPLWLALGAGAILLAFLALAAAPSRLATACLAVAVAGELWGASTSLEYNNPNPPGVYLDSRPSIDALRDVLPPGRVLAVARTGYQPFDAPLIQGDHGATLGVRGVGAGLINTKFKDTLNPNLPMVLGIPVVDGYDGGVLPFRRYVEFKSLIVPPERNQPDGLLRDQLGRDQAPTLPPADRLRQWGVTYVVRDTMDDRLIDGTYFDNDASLDLLPHATVRLPGPALALPAVLQRPDLPAGTAPSGATLQAGTSRPRLADMREVAMVASRPGPSPSGIVSVTVELLGPDGRVAWSGRLGVAPFSSASSGPGAIAARLPGDTEAPGTYVVRLPVADGRGLEISAVTVRLDVVGQATTDGSGNRATVHALSLVGDGRSWPVGLTHGGALQLVHRSDVKVYRLEDPPARARLVTRTVVTGSDADALAALASGPPDEASVVLQVAPPPVADAGWRGRVRAGVSRAWRLLGRDDASGYLAGAVLPAPSETTGARVSLVEDLPESLRLQVSTDAPAILVIRDTFFPGWHATVDGRDAPVWRADLLFRAVPVPAGDHVVDLTFRQRTFEVGLAISGVAALVAVALLVVPATAAGRRAWPPSPSTTRPLATTVAPVTSPGSPVLPSPAAAGEGLREGDCDEFGGGPASAAVDDAPVAFGPESWSAHGRTIPATYLDDDAVAGLYIASRDADPEVARESRGAPSLSAYASPAPAGKDARGPTGEGSAQTPPRRARMPADQREREAPPPADQRERGAIDPS